MFKYLLVKLDDIQNGLNESDKEELDRIMDEIEYHRASLGKGDNKYMVFNTDEPYAAELYAIMHRHGHTPCADCKNVCQRGQECPWFALWEKMGQVTG